MRDIALLAVIVVSDEEDCSIKDRELFDTPEWNGGVETLNTACNFPASNETNYLFDAQYFRDRLVSIKGGAQHAVVFGAIVGVPIESDASCEGLGDTLNDCLDHAKMQYNPREFDESGSSYFHFEPACERRDERDESLILTSARPGRRYVKVAEAFGDAGYLYSICNADWSSALTEIGALIAKCVGPSED